MRSLGLALVAAVMVALLGACDLREGDGSEYGSLPRVDSSVDRTVGQN
ncbi:hypothetical protein [Actinophytocola xinjiangensis]|nr:hypothetical protein [Actinophytocola xinjiangensis]